MTGQFILDVTSHRRGFGVQPIIDAAARRTRANQDVEKTVWLVPSHLAAAFAAAQNTESNHETRICDVVGPLLWNLIKSEIEGVHAAAPGRVVTVVTWDPFVHTQARNYGPGVFVERWADWLPASPMRGAASMPGRWPTLRQPGAMLPSTEELQRRIVDYLRVNGVAEQAPVYRSRLRPALIRANPDLYQASFHPAFAATFKTALDAAIQGNLIGEYRPMPGGELIWLVGPALPPMPAPELTASAAAAPAGGSMDAQERSVATPPTYGRTAEFRRRLTACGIFCEKRERDILTEALRKLLTSGPHPISRLRRELPRTAADMAAEQAVCQQTSFSRIVNFFIKLVLLCGALKGQDGGQIERNAGADASMVVELAEDATDRMERYYMERILERSDVKDREHWQLALAMFREFDTSVPLDDKLDRIAVLIADLSDRVFLTSDGVYEYVPKAPAPLRAVRNSA